MGVGFGLIAIVEKARRPLTLSQIAEAASMPPSQAHLYLKSYVEVGLLQLHAQTLMYELGPYAVRLGFAAIDQNDVATAAQLPMKSLQEKLKIPVFLTVWAHNGPTIIAKADFDVSLPMMIRVGSVLSLAQSATGHLFLAFHKDDEVHKVLQEEMAVISIRPEIVATWREQARSGGFSSSDSRLNAGFASIAVPIFDQRGHMAGALTILGVNSHPAFADIEASAKVLKETSQEITQALRQN